MKTFLKQIAFFLPFLLWQCTSPNTSFVLVGEQENATILVSEGISDPLKMAVNDLVNDVEKITGKQLTIISTIEEAKENTLVIGNLAQAEDRALLLGFAPELDTLAGKWENYLVSRGKSTDNITAPLIIAGSDERGAMFAIYHFIEEYLGVDPYYHWTDMAPDTKEILSFEDISIHNGTPDFKYRGWFINDEDLLTEFINGAGDRDIDYRYYGQVVHPDIMAKVVETLVRDRFNLIIPASFIDILNTPEKRLVEEAAKRGLFISQHHVEPVGVSAFSFFNYWEDKGEDLKFSFYSSRPQLEEVWETYVKEWAKIPNVIWQIGLRGIADRPMWRADPSVPQSDAERAALISEAMQYQVDLIKKYDNREQVPITTTLWAEGSAFQNEGLLTLPEEALVVFSDNSPGYRWQKDFYETERETSTEYGVYYHHQLWSSGPHLAQGVPIEKTHEMLQLAYENNAHDYVIMNVSNIREFVLGIAASSEVLWDVEAFDATKFWQEWTENYYRDKANGVVEAYQHFFDSYQLHPDTGTPYTLDGQMRSYGRNQLNELTTQIESPKKWEELQKQEKDLGRKDAFSRSISDMHPERGFPTEGYRDAMLAQEAQLEKCLESLRSVKSQLDGKAATFLETNLETQALILLGMTRWCKNVILANLSYQENSLDQCEEHLKEAIKAFDVVDKGKALASRGKWEHWYRGDKKLNVASIKDRTQEILTLFERQNTK